MQVMELSNPTVSGSDATYSAAFKGDMGVIKALIAKQTKALPPRSHNLMRLAEMVISEIPEEQADFFRYLSRYYIQSRYPEEFADLAKQINQEKALEVFHKTQEMFQWLSSML